MLGRRGESWHLCLVSDPTEKATLGVSHQEMSAVGVFTDALYQDEGSVVLLTFSEFYIGSGRWALKGMFLAIY